MENELLNQYAENDPNIADIRKKLSIIRHECLIIDKDKIKWSADRNTKTRFLKNNAEWLKGCISLPKAGRYASNHFVCPQNNCVVTHIMYLLTSFLTFFHLSVKRF